jgi:alpha-ketoglutarate-dependent taurine dioxygenase
MSIFVDSLRAATALRTNHPTDFETLATTPVAFHYINDGHHLHYEHPTIELSGPVKTSILNAAERPINHINYSPPFQAPLLLSSTLPAFYPALARFASLLEAPDSTYTYTLEEGDAVLFDNRRVLHARTSFQDRLGDEVEKEDTNRWLKGCYLEADALLDRARVLRAKAGGGLL